MPRDPDEILEALPLIGGRLSIAIDEIIRLMKEDLPLVIDRFNTINNLTAANKIPKATNVRIAPNDLESVEIDEILIEYSTEMRVNGTDNFTGFTTLMIHSIDERIVQGRHVQKISDRADLMAATLWACLGDYLSPITGERLWSDLSYKTRSGLPGEWRKYNGVTLTYQLVQDMNDGWV